MQEKNKSSKIFNLPSHDALDSLHHAYFLVGDRAAARAAIEELFSDILKIDIGGNPNIRWIEAENFTIDEARALKSEHFLKSVGDTEHSFFIVSFNSIGLEAQQALLKVFEDPIAGSHFFVIASSLHGILPTLLSRFVVLHLPRTTPEISRAKKFAESQPPARFRQVKKITEEKDRSEAMLFLNELETFYAKLLRDGGKIKNTDHTLASALKEIISARDFLQNRSSSVKMLLENLALVLPVV